ncbi:methyl-accepting chemotaxis protein [Marinobacter adhaerens]|uniref:Methyl-accepting chemotaxis protein n=3 Tax=Marinobacter adhaerens TaxID=1033846 RepID=A0ABX8IDQ6_9GAMM|nr:methyl-accepting chemotaxis protein [Marinobacter adhaerens]ADP97921.1 methyl-accepting chemotaxis protein [Marinobacter adhaerens HP15]MBW4977552.1 methyl-accepting chemotaxis protein [Marinobacter adhaerens]QWV11962.1 methyl-accepting chemotaxis protein [Marinobacter adhaerens]
MNKISVIHRLYAGFGLLCVIIVCWGAFNISVMSSFSGTTDKLTSDVFPLSGLIQEMEAHRSETAKYVVEVVSADDPEALDARLEKLSNSIERLRGSGDTLLTTNSSAMFPPLQAVNRTAQSQLSKLDRSTDALASLKARVLSVSDAVNTGLTEFLANNGEIKRTLVREGTEPAGRDIYIRDLFTTVMENLANIELLVMQMVSTEDARQLDAIVENLRFNTQTIEQDISALVEEVPRLDGLPALVTTFLSAVNDQAGIISQYSGYRQRRLELDNVAREVEENLAALASALDEAAKTVSDRASASVFTLDATALTSEKLVYWLLPVVVLLTLATSFRLGRMISRPLQVTQAHLAAMAEGDYSQVLEFPACGEFIDLKSSVNRLSEAMATVLGSLQQAGSDISVIASGNARFAREFNERTRTQSDELGSIAAAMTEMEASAREVARSVRDTHDLVGKVNLQVDDNLSAAKRGMDCVADLEVQAEQTAGKLRQLEQASFDIGRITEAIDDIANQTNLLALNAAIESARAGDAGRGFAVVADEVRGLAQKTTESTDSIRSLVEGLQAEASESVSSMNSSFEQLRSVRELMASVSEGAGRIGSAMERIHQGAEHIRHGMDEQENVSQSVARQVSDISGSAAEGLESIDDLVTTCDRLEDSVTNIESLMARFRIQ